MQVTGVSPVSPVGDRQVTTDQGHLSVTLGDQMVNWTPAPPLTEWNENTTVFVFYLLFR